MHVMAISEKKKRDHEFRGERAGAYGRVCWRKEQAETSSSEYNGKKKQNQTASAENTLKARAVGQSGERRPLYWGAGDSSDKDQLSCWGKHSRWKELMVIGAKFRRHATSPRDWRSWGLRLIRREISDGRLGTVPFPATWARACGLMVKQPWLVQLPGEALACGLCTRVLLRLLLKTEGNE